MDPGSVPTKETHNEHTASPPPRRSRNQAVVAVPLSWLLVAATVLTPAAAQTPPVKRCGDTDNTKTSFMDCDDRDALIAIYNGLSASPWDDTTSPSSIRQPFSGIGKTTGSQIRFDDTTGRVIEINALRKGGSWKSNSERVLAPEIGDLTALEKLNLDFYYQHAPGVWYGTSNYVELPGEIGRLTELTSLTNTYSGSNNMGGRLPPELGQLTNLEVLDLSGNRLWGPIPPELGNLTKLTRLELTTNRLTGPIPAELGNLTRLTKLELTGNPLSGSIPPELGNLTGLKILDLYGLGLTGSIPPELGNLTGLEILDLTHTHVTGFVPPELANLINLKHTAHYHSRDYHKYGGKTSYGGIRLEYTDLYGPLPVELARLKERHDYTNGDERLINVSASRNILYPAEYDLTGGSKDYAGVRRLCAPRPLIRIIDLAYRGNSIYDTLPNCEATELELKPGTPRVPGRPLRPSQPVLAPNDQQLTVSWGEAYNGGSPITAYGVQYKLKTATVWTTVTRTDATATTQAITGLTNDVAYEVRVRATNAQGSSPWSDVAEAKPSDVTVTAYQMDAPLLTPASQRIALTWSAPAGITPTGYEIRYRPAGTPTWTSHPHTGTGTSNTITNTIANNTTYQVQLRTTTASTTTPWSASAVGVFGASSTLCTDANGGTHSVCTVHGLHLRAGTVSRTTATGLTY